MTKIIAIDGPAASGKGSLARKLAGELGYAHLDTGALYRLVGWQVLEAGGDPADEKTALNVAEGLSGTLNPEILQNPALRTDEAGSAASKVAAYASVRTALIDFQKDFAKNPPNNAPGAVLDGRDIGTVICPEADVKLFITADVEARANRRLKELQSKGIEATYGAVLADMRERDARDSGREAAPMKPADDAFVIDTTSMSEANVLAEALSLVHGRGASL